MPDAGRPVRPALTHGLVTVQIAQTMKKDVDIVWLIIECVLAYKLVSRIGV